MLPVEDVSTNHYLIYNPTLDSAQYGPELPKVSIRRSLEFCGKTWNVHFSRLCPNRSISVQLEDVFLCDGRDLSAKPLCYRLHMYSGYSAGDSISFEEKLKRMQSWQEAILMYDNLMSSEIETNSMESLNQALNNLQIPRADLAILDTPNPSLRRLFEYFNFTVSTEPPHPFVVSWLDLTSVAKQGRIVSDWVKLKK